MTRLFKDARMYQILFLGTLLLTGALLRDFSIRPLQVLLTFLAGLATQALFIRLLKLQNVKGQLSPLDIFKPLISNLENVLFRFSYLNRAATGPGHVSQPSTRPAPGQSPGPRQPVNYLSAVITCLGTSTLLRADNYWVHPLAVSLALSAKFLFRIRGKHVYNPTNLALILSLCFLPGAWSSAGQWGHDMALVAWIFMLGATIANRAGTRDLSWMFLGFYLSLVALRVTYLGQPWSVFLHALETGSLIHFTFFMISDPMTSPNHPRMKVLHCALVALIGFTWQFGFFKINGLYWALFIATSLVPLWDFLLPGSKYVWNKKEPKDGKVSEVKLGQESGVRPPALGRPSAA